MSIQVLLALAYLFFYANKHVFHWPQLQGVQQYYGDVYAPLLILTLFQVVRALLEKTPRTQIFISWRKQIFTFAVLAFVFEYYLPKNSPHQVADGWDVFAYGLGVILFQWFVNGYSPKTSEIHSSSENQAKSTDTAKA